MEMTPLALVVLLGFGLLIAVCLTAWTAVSYDSSGSDDGTTESPQRPFVTAADERPNGRRGVQGQRPDRGARSVEPGRGSRTAAAGGSEVSGDVRSKTNRSEMSGGAWRSAGSTTVTARRVVPERAIDSGRTEPGRTEAGRDTPGGGGSRPKQTRGAGTEPVERKQEHDEDAFERFLRARPDDIDIG